VPRTGHGRHGRRRRVQLAVAGERNRRLGRALAESRAALRIPSDISPPRSNWPCAAALAEITFEHSLRGLFQQIEGGLTVEQVKGEVADRARIAERVEDKLGDLPHQATVVSAWLARFAAAAAADAPH